jgi:hypothetical protein
MGPFFLFLTLGGAIFLQNIFCCKPVMEVSVTAQNNSQNSAFADAVQRAREVINCL